MNADLTPRYIVRLKDRCQTLRAANVEYVDGWLRVDAIVYRLEENGTTAWQVPAHIVTRTFPASVIVSVDEIAEAA